MDAALRVARLIHISMLSATVLYAFVAEQVRGHADASGAVSNEFYWLLVLPVLVLAVAALVVRNKVVAVAESGLRLEPGDTALLGRWRMGHIVGLALAEAVVLFGFVVRVLGGTLAQAGLLYAAGIAVMLMLTPRRP